MTAPIRRIVVGVDGSENSRLALIWAVDLAEAFDAEVVAVHAPGLLVRVDADHLEPTQRHRDQIRRRFESEWCRPLDRSGLRSRRLLVDGNPVSAMLVAGDDLDADLLVVGSRGIGGFPALALGSTSHQLVQYASRPVLVVPRTWVRGSRPANDTDDPETGQRVRLPTDNDILPTAQALAERV